MADRNRWDEDRNWRSARDEDDEDEYGSSFGSARYGRRQGQRQSWQQDYSGEFDRDQSYGSGQSYGGSTSYGSSRSYGSDQSYGDDYASRRAGGSRGYGYGADDQSDHGSGREYQSSGQGYPLGRSYQLGQGGWSSQSEQTGQPRQTGQSQGRQTYRGQSGYEGARSQSPRYDERTEYQTSDRRYAGTGYSHYGAGASNPTGDYFTGSDYGSGAHSWDRNSTQASAGSGRYGSTYSESGYRGEMGRGAYGSSSYGSGSGYGSGQSYQREMGSTASTQGAYGHQERGFLQRAGDEVMSWFGDEDAARRREMDHRGHGPSDYTRSDERIREDANDRLTDDWRVDARRISVTVSDGELTLSGTVPSRDAKHRAEECVEHIAGVHHVQNNLRVDSSAMNNLTGSTSTQSSLGSSADTTTSASSGAKSGSATGTSTGTGSTTTTTGNTGATSRGSTTGSTSA